MQGRLNTCVECRERTTGALFATAGGTMLVWLCDTTCQPHHNLAPRVERDIPYPSTLGT